MQANKHLALRTFCLHLRSVAQKNVIEEMASPPISRFIIIRESTISVPLKSANALPPSNHGNSNW